MLEQKKMERWKEKEEYKVGDEKKENYWLLTNIEE